MTFILITLLIVTCTCGLSIVYSSLLCSISPMPTSSKVKPIILALLNKYTSGNIVYDLGSGWGTLVFAISSESPDYQVKGLERSPVPYLYASLINKVINRNNCKFIYNDFFSIPIQEADVVVCYLCTGLMSQLRVKLEQELKPGALVISSTFALPGWQPIETVTANDLYRSKVYVYRKKKCKQATTAQTQPGTVCRPPVNKR